METIILIAVSIIALYLGHLAVKVECMCDDIHWFRKVIENGVAIAVERKEDE